MGEPTGESLDEREALENQIGQWRRWVLKRRSITPSDAEELEDNLRGRVADLRACGLDDDEAFLVAVKRMGNLDDVSREFAREHSERLWKQLVLVPEEPVPTSRYRELGVVVGLAVAAGLAVKALVATHDGGVVLANAAFAVLPFLAAYFAWSRRLPARTSGVLVAVAAVFALAVNLFPFKDMPPNGLSMTFVLAATHVPVVLWLLLGVAYTGGAWREDARRMDFVRFTGEQLIYVALIALGGGLLLGLTAGTFAIVNVDISPFYQDWLMPFAVPGAFLVAAWLVEAKKNVIENMAPVLTRVFTPLTIVMLGAMLVVLLANGSLISVNRDLLILMDAVLVLVLALLLYSISARDPLAPPTTFDWLQLVLVVAAFAVNGVALTAMVTRIAEFGWTANKTAALGLNIVLLIHLVWTGRQLLGFLRGTRGFAATERWQTRYLPVYAAWAGVVVLVFPPAFSFA